MAPLQQHATEALTVLDTLGLAAFKRKVPNIAPFMAAYLADPLRQYI